MDIKVTIAFLVILSLRSSESSPSSAVGGVWCPAADSCNNVFWAPCVKREGRGAGCNFINFFL